MRRFPAVLGVLAVLVAVSACDDNPTNLRSSEEPGIAPAFDATLSPNFFIGPPPAPTVELKEYSRGWFRGDVAGLTLSSVGEVPELLPATVTETLAPGGSFTEAKTLTVPLGWLPAKADIMFALDVTGSMGGEIANVQNNSVNIMNAVLAEIPDSRFAVMSHADYPGFTAILPDDGNLGQCVYCDYDYGYWLYWPSWWVYGDPGTTQDPSTCSPGTCACAEAVNPDPLGSWQTLTDDCNPDTDYPYRVDQEFTDITSDVGSALSALYPIGGRDQPESSTRLLFEAYNQPLGWRDGAAKFLLYWTDAPPHACDLSLGLVCDEENGLQRSTGPDPGPDGVLTPALWTLGADPIDPDPDNLDLGEVLQTLADEDITLIPLFSGPTPGSIPFGDYWQCYAEQTRGTSFPINEDGTVPGPETIATYILNMILSETERVVELSIRAQAGYEDWVTTPLPFSHDLGEAAVDVDFDLDFHVPAGTVGGTYNFEVCAFADGATIACQTVEINVVSNRPPNADPNGPYLGAVGSLIGFDGSGSSDPDGDPLTYVWDFGDGVTGTGNMPTHAYSSAGIYDVCLVVDDGQASSLEVCTIAIIYDPAGGFVTGGGWIESPAGAYVPEPDLAGKASFGFVAKYKKGANIPDGNTEFQFQTAGLDFHSSAYEWLVVNQGDANAQFKGSGTVNGEGEFKFMIWAGDGTPDTFRIKIWEEDAFGVETTLYDNGSDQAISGGSIVIHTK